MEQSKDEKNKKIQDDLGKIKKNKSKNMEKNKEEINDINKNSHLETIKQLKSKDLKILIETQNKNNLEKQYDNFLDEIKQIDKLDHQIEILKKNNNISQDENNLLENEKKNTKNNKDELILILEQAEQLDKIKNHKIKKLNNKITELKVKNDDIYEKMKNSQDRTIKLLSQNNEDLDNKVYMGIKREKGLLDIIKLLKQFKYKIIFDGNGRINKIENKIIKVNKENDSYHKELQYQITLKDTEINDLKRTLFISQIKYNYSKKK